MPEQVCIGLGSNLGQREQHLYQALRSLDSHERISVISVAPLYASRPVGPQDQPDFLNSAAVLSTDLAPLALLDLLLGIENASGRQRTRHWGERTLDLDILLLGTRQIHEPRLTVPHPQLSEREFVLRPLADIAEDWLIPGDKVSMGPVSMGPASMGPVSVAQALAACNAQGVWYHGPCNWEVPSEDARQ